MISSNVQRQREPLHVLLFDLDAVLLTSEGYYESLRRAVALLAEALGFGPIRLSQEDIDVFESLDITAEWDSCAMCAALLLARAWEADPARTLPERPPLPAGGIHGLPAPDFRTFALSLADGEGRVARPLEQARQRLQTSNANLSPAQSGVLDRILGQARDPLHSLTFHLIQEFNLGSSLYSEIYGRAGTLHTSGMLAAQDRPTLSLAEREGLNEWLTSPRRHAAIVTNRPSRSGGSMFNTPEAEIGVRAAGMDRLPFIASGALGWFAEQHGLPPQAYLKPSPVHILTGLRLAVDGEVDPALAAAHDLVARGRSQDSWSRFDGARVSLFEDAAKGMRGAHAARESLAGAGVHVDLRMYGITGSPAKARALERLGARVFDTLGPALQEAMQDDQDA